MNATVHLAPLLSWPVLAGLAAACMVLAGVAVWRRARGAWLRLAFFSLLVAALVNPRLVIEDRQRLPDIALVMVDDSPSQRLEQRAVQTEAALAAVRERLGRLGDLEVRVEPVGGGDQGTRLFDGIERALADVPRRRLAGIVAITDGRIHDVPADGGAGLGAPFHALLTGRPGERDRRLSVVRQPGFALVGKNASLVVRIDDPGSGGSARLDVRLDGGALLVDFVPLNRDVSIDLPIRHAGPNVVELAVEAAPGELSESNNRLAVSVSGVRDRLKVLLVSGQPHAGERTWRNLLKSDPAVDLVHFTILRPPEKDDRTPIRELSLITFPVRELFEEKLHDFDLVVFDRYRGRGILSLDYYQALTTYVRRGGALLAAVGPEFAEGSGLTESALGEVLPALPTGAVIERLFRPHPTELGRRHPVTGPLVTGKDGAAAWGHWVRQLAVGKVRGQVLLAGVDDKPLLVVDRVGDGRIALLLSDSLWLWARGHDGGGPHDEVLRRLSHWLMQEPDLEEESLSAEIRGARLDIIRRSLSPEPVAVTVTRPDGTASRIPLEPAAAGDAVASLPADQPGVWRVEDGRRQAVAAAGGANPLEWDELTASAEILRPVAAATNGSVRFIEQDQIPDFRRTGAGAVGAGRGWIGLPSRGEYAVTGARDVPLLPAFLLLIFAVGTILSAWWREGR
jgi:hypothetical protein